MKAIYNELFNTLKEQPEHKRPVFVDRTKETEKILADWDKEYAALRTIPCHPGCVGKWSDGQEVVNEKDYAIRCVYFKDGEEYVYDNPQAEWETMGFDHKILAFPLPVMSEQGDDEFNLHYEYAGMLAHCLGITINGNDLEEKAFPKLKSKFIISKK